MNTLAQSATNKKMLKQPSFRLAMAGLKFAENRGAHKGKMGTEEGNVGVRLSNAAAPHQNADEHPRRLLPEAPLYKLLVRKVLFNHYEQRRSPPCQRDNRAPRTLHEGAPGPPS